MRFWGFQVSSTELPVNSGSTSKFSISRTKGKDHVSDIETRYHGSTGITVNGALDWPCFPAAFRNPFSPRSTRLRMRTEIDTDKTARTWAGFDLHQNTRCACLCRRFRLLPNRTANPLSTLHRHKLRIVQWDDISLSSYGRCSNFPIPKLDWSAEENSSTATAASTVCAVYVKEWTEILSNKEDNKKCGNIKYLHKDFKHIPRLEKSFKWYTEAAFSI